MIGAISGAHTRWAKAALLALWVIASAYVSLPIARAAAPADDGQAIFQQKCQSCHTIGYGRGVGPDLVEVTTQRDRNWIIGFITAPDQMIARGDPTANQLVQEYGTRMPNLGISTKDAEALFAYIEAKSKEERAEHPGGTGGAAQPAIAIGSAVMGRDLFTGSVAFKGGGVACISCHNANSVGGFGGGNVGKDLTTSFANLGQNGLTPILKTAPFPVMKEAFADHPLTDAEIGDLMAFLQEESAAAPQAQAPSPFLFPIIALIALIVIIGLIQLIWKGRLQGVRQPLIKGGSK